MLPSISGPELVLQASYDDDHRLDLSWEWQYRIGDIAQRAPLPAGGPGAPDEGYRDAGAERAVLDGLAAAGLPWREHGLARRTIGVARPLAETLLPNAQLTGMATMRFTTELLPRLPEVPGLVVEVTGEPADYREAGESLRIAVSTTERTGDNDWFDLDVTITVEGRKVPFLQVFLALSRGEPQLLLPDGVWFGLDQPELQALARLIDEARALQELPPDQLRISRFQAVLGRADHARRRGPPGRILAAAGPGPADGQRDRPRAGPGRAAGRAAPVPAGRVRLAVVPVGAPAGRDPGRRHGPG